MEQLIVLAIMILLAAFAYWMTWYVAAAIIAILIFMAIFYRDDGCDY